MTLAAEQVLEAMRDWHAGTAQESAIVRNLSENGIRSSVRQVRNVLVRLEEEGVVELVHGGPVGVAFWRVKAIPLPPDVPRGEVAGG